MPQSLAGWPPLPPWPAGETGAVWLDGSLASATLAGWVARSGADWLALLAGWPEQPQRARAAAAACCALWGVRSIACDIPTAIDEPPGWAIAGSTAIAAGASWLALPSAQAPAAAPPIAPRLLAAESALGAYGLSGLYVPFGLHDAFAIARLALALALPFEASWDCAHEHPCGACAGCTTRARALRQLGLRDPLLASTGGPGEGS